MIASIRAFVKSWFATALLSILIIAFAVTGIYTYGSRGGGGHDSVISVGARTVTDEEFKTTFERYRDQAGQQNQQTLTNQDAAAHGLDRQVLDLMAGQVALAEALSRMGLRPSDRLVLAQIRTNTNFFNQVTGQFDEQQYRQQLGQHGLTPDAFEDIMRTQISQNHFATAASTGFQIPRSYVALEAAIALQQRDADFVAIPSTSVHPPATPPTDAQLTQFMRDHAAEMRWPELRTISVVRFSAAALAPTMTVDPAAVEREFNFRRDTLSTPEKRSFVQIPLRQPAQAADVAARLGRGEDPVAIARSIGVDPIVYTDRPRSAVTDARIAAAAFAMTAGQTSGLVQGDVGPAVIRVTAITPGHQATLAESRTTIENQLKAQMAEQRAYALSEAYDRAHSGGASMAVAAQQAGATVVSIGPMAANGQTINGPPNPILTPQILQTAFHDLSQGQESDVIEVGRGESYAVRVERVDPPHVPALSEVHDLVLRQFVMQGMATELRARITAIQARIDRGENLQAIASSTGGQVGHVAGITLATAQSNQALGRTFLAGIFGARVGESFVGEVHGGVAAGKLTAIRVGDLSTIARMIEQSREQVSHQVFGSIAQMAQDWAKGHLPVRTDIDRARQVLNIDASQLPAQPGAPATPAAGARPAAPGQRPLAQ